MIVEIKPEQAIEKIDKIATFIVERKMAPAALLAIESFRPLNFIGSQLMYFLAPFAEVIFKPKEYEEFAALIEKDEYITLLLKRIEEMDEEMYRESRKEKAKLRKRKMNQIKRLLKFKKDK